MTVKDEATDIRRKLLAEATDVIQTIIDAYLVPVSTMGNAELVTWYHAQRNRPQDGLTARERERRKRLRQRWQQRFASRSPEEQELLLASLNEVKANA